jgi:hypothetical protein
MQLGRDAVPPHPSDSDKHLPAVEPPAEGPEDAEDEEAGGEAAGGAGEEVVAEPGLADAVAPTDGPDLVVWALMFHAGPSCE